ncbi:SDR family oxidoreductase [Spirochaeta isovalerica]|uniref:NAD(P)-dependent dehydrogenase (Short-subunit alcohol dehydrogenase family) n=1 Tax=Spirochaeta isovalerica TaxID=150 RepID=A0A841R9M7_9SPIO|nr:SDR family oxidoreductase [Spirochaeta isovalerica]MBB6479710.1 NAD(P)-dependent dehydrogenase (short-subunit alcohol dehydrogenase family) [Spirochaeta isovalerica]
MIQIDLSGKSVLITGGTKGIGLASALKLAKAGASTYLTYKWGSADMESIKADFIKEGASVEPVFIQADVSIPEDTKLVMETIREKEEKLDVFISNVGFAQSPKSLEEYKKRSLYKTLDYSTWPLVDYTQQIKAVFGEYPEKVLAISSDGPDHFYQGYDYVAASKSLLEFLTKYMSVHLFNEGKGSTVNAIRFGTVKTDSFNQIFGEEFFEFMAKDGIEESMFLTPEECADSVFAMCSGLMNAMNGQIINVDYGFPYQDNSMMRYLKTKLGK